MPYDIETKDGIVLKNIPDDIAPDSDTLKNRVQLIRQSNEFKQLQKQPAEGLSPQPEPAQDTFGSRLQADFDRRKKQISDLANLAVEGKISEAEAIGRSGLKMAQLLPDTALNVLSEVTPDFIEKPVVEQIGNAASYLADTRAGRATIGAINDFNQQYPITAGRVGSAVDALNIALPFKKVGGESLVSASSKVADAAIDKTGDIAGRAVTRGVGKLATPARVMPNSEQLAGMGVKAYEAARASGEVFDAPSVTNKFIAAIDSAKPKMIADAVETDLSQALESGLGKYRKLADKPLGIDEIDIIDKDISNLKDKAFRAGENQLGGELSNIQNTLRQSVAESPSGQTLAQARDLYRRKYQMEDVERIFRNAEGRPNEATIIQTGFRNLSNQARKKGSGYTKEQIALMDKAAKGGLSIDALKFMSSRFLSAIAGATGGVAAGATAYVGNLAAGAGATALQTAKANKLAKSITKGITVDAEPTRINRLAQRFTKQDLQAAFEARKGTNTPEQMLTLPAPQRTIFVDENGVAVPLTQADREIIGSGFGEPYSQENLYRGTRSENQTNRAGTTFLTPQKEYAAGYGNVENYKLNLGKSIDLTSYGETARIDDIYNALKDKFGRDTAEKLLNDSSVRANDTNIDVYSIFRSPENVKILKDKGIDFARFAQTSDNKPVESVVVFNPSKLKKGNKQ